MTRVAGIDRWRGGWAIAANEGETLRLWSVGAIEEVVAEFDDCAAVAIDMPIGLAVFGRRSAETDLRGRAGPEGFLGVHQSDARAAVAALTQAEATERNRAHGGPGISAQAFGLFASIRELRAALSRHDSTHWWETHPETAFALMNGGSPLASKRSAVGVAQRLELLRREFVSLDAGLLDSPARVPIDDVLDALAALWSARRIAAGHATRFGPDERDDQGFALGIRV